ncbi:chitobiase/beta-hexosaminidase C-terminal domain-containing protein, partial [Spirochaetota bacterium]
TEYNGTIAVTGDNTTVTIKAIAVVDGMDNSDKATATYTIDYGSVSTPYFDTVGGTHNQDLSVQIFCSTSGSTIYYTKDGTDPTTDSTEYNGTIAVTGDNTTVTIRAIAVKNGMDISAEASAEYKIDYPKIAALEFVPGGGTFDDDIVVEIKTTTTEVVIRYTKDGTDPTDLSDVYEDPIPVTGDNTTVTIRAFATKGGMKDSDIKTENYVIDYNRVSTPQFSPVSGTYNEDINVTISCSTYGATIHYTTNKSVPTTDSTEYTVPIPVAGDGNNMTIRAIAVYGTMNDSSIATSEYSIDYLDIPDVSAEDGKSVDNVEIKWNVILGATGYYVYRNTSDTTVGADNLNDVLNSGLPILGDTFYDNTAIPGTLFYYWVRAYNESTGSFSGYSDSNTGYRQLSTPKVTATNGTSTSEVTVSWGTIEGATGYYVYRNTSDSTEGADVLNDNSPVSETSYDDIDADAGTLYYYWVIAHDSDPNHNSSYSTVTTGHKRLSTPSVTATDGTIIAHVYVDWDVIPGADSYTVSRRTSPAGLPTTLTSSTSATSFNDTSANAGTLYYYNVIAHNTSGFDSYSGSDTGFKDLDVPTVTATSGAYLTHVYVDWDVIPGATGYMVYRNTSNTITGAINRTPSGTTLTHYSDTGAVPGTQYYFFVRAGDDSPGQFSEYSPGIGGYRSLSAPTGLSVSACTTNDYIWVGWNSTHTTEDVDRYYLYRNDEDI